MFCFRAGTAVVAGLDLVERAPVVDLPPVHVGIHTGPVISQDGDVYGGTVNLAARIASYAQAGQVVVSEETAHRSGERQCGSTRSERSSSRVAKPLPLYQAYQVLGTPSAATGIEPGDSLAVSTNRLLAHVRAGIASLADDADITAGYAATTQGLRLAKALVQ